MAIDNERPLSGKVALVTGAAKRLGRAIALDLARAGAGVAIHFRSSEPQARALAATIKGWGCPCALVQADLSEPDAASDVIGSVVERLGRLDVLVNNASLFEPQRPSDGGAFDVRTWARMLQVNLVAPAALCHCAVASLKSGGEGRIVNLTDAAVDRPWASHLAYCASKAGLENLTRGLAAAFAPHVQVNAVAPGIVLFPPDEPVEARERLLARVPSGRAATVAEVAQAVMFLITGPRYITGQTLVIDGGRGLK